jgi:beta-lactam-binding protein with PASTA domain
MPELSGLPLAEAQARLASAGLLAPKIVLVTDAAVARTTVVAQTPVRGQRVDPQSSITLQVAE